MLYESEREICRAIGLFSTCGQITSGVHSSIITDAVDLAGVNSTQYPVFMPGQCQAFLTSGVEFIWWVERWKLQRNAAPNTPKIEFTEKEVFPAKVTGISLPLFNTTPAPRAVTVRYRDGLVRYSNVPQNLEIFYGVNHLRPGFGEQIQADLQRPLQAVTVTTNNLGLNLSLPGGGSVNTSNGPKMGGRLMSMAFYIDPEIATKYKTSNSKKKPKSLNWDSQVIPSHPPYTPYSGGGYGG